VRVQRCADPSTDHQVFVCNLRPVKPNRICTNMQDQKVLLNKVGRPGGQACETTFADNTLPLFHDLPGYTVTADA